MRRQNFALESTQLPIMTDLLHYYYLLWLSLIPPLAAFGSQNFSRINFSAGGLSFSISLKLHFNVLCKTTFYLNHEPILKIPWKECSVFSKLAICDLLSGNDFDNILEWLHTLHLRSKFCNVSLFDVDAPTYQTTKFEVFLRGSEKNLRNLP